MNDRQRVQEMLRHVLRCLLSQCLTFVPHRHRDALICAVNPLTGGDKALLLSRRYLVPNLVCQVGAAVSTATWNGGRGCYAGIDSFFALNGGGNS